MRRSGVLTAPELLGHWRDMPRPNGCNQLPDLTRVAKIRLQIPIPSGRLCTSMRTGSSLIPALPSLPEASSQLSVPTDSPLPCCTFTEVKKPMARPFWASPIAARKARSLLANQPRR